MKMSAIMTARSCQTVWLLFPGCGRMTIIDSVYGTVLESIFQVLNFRELRVGLLCFGMIPVRFKRLRVFFV